MDRHRFYYTSDITVPHKKNILLVHHRRASRYKKIKRNLQKIDLFLSIIPCSSYGDYFVDLKSTTAS